MKQIEITLGQNLFDRLEEIVKNPNLGPEERIPKYRKILEDLFKILTADALEYMSNLYARQCYVEEKSDIPKSIRDYTHSLRIYANKVLHEKESITPITDIDDHRSSYQMAEILKFYSKNDIPEKIRDFYAESAKEIAEQQPKKNEYTPKDYYNIEGVVIDVNVDETVPGKVFANLTCNTEEFGKINLRLKTFKSEKGFGTDHTRFAKVVRPYQQFKATNISAVNDSNTEFSTNKNSFLILEPDYLIDVQALSDCRMLDLSKFPNYKDVPFLFLLKRFTKGQITDRVMIGNIVGKMLDDIITDPEYSYNKTFEAVMRSNSFAMLCIADEEGKYNKTNISKIFLEARDHEKTLLWMAAELKKRYPEGEFYIEPTFISNRYGLQGRIDLLIHTKPGSNEWYVIELKSSKKFPFFDPKSIYKNHEAQAIGYDLLMKSVFKNRIGRNAILYSGASVKESPLRIALADNYIEVFDLLMTRNKVVQSEIELAEGENKPFLEILNSDHDGVPPYMKETIQEIQNTISSLKQLENDYFYGFLHFIYREMVYAKVGPRSLKQENKSQGYSSLWNDSRTDKEDNYDVILYLKIRDIKPEDNAVTLEQSKEMMAGKTPISNFRIGDSAILYPTPNPEAELHPLLNQILKCRVVEIKGGSLKVELVHKQLDMKYFKSSDFWALDRDFREIGFRESIVQLYRFISSSSTKKDLIFGNKEPEFRDAVDIVPNELDEIQNENLIKALSAKDYYLIQGPPGTGKTSKVLIEILRNLIEKEQNIMIVAYTNRAVDEICDKLVELEFDCIRLGFGEREYYWSSLSDKLNLDELHEKVRSTNVFVSTVSKLGSSMDIFRLKSFETLIVDEASQILEPQIVGLLPYFRKWIMIGDENQLPAVVVQDINESKTDSEKLNEISLTNFRESLFYRLKRNAVKKGWDCHGMLKYQYRMHPQISEFPSKEFYKGELLNKVTQDTTPVEKSSGNSYDELLNSERTIFIPSAKENNHKINKHEASIVVKLVKSIVKKYGEEFDMDKTVGIITPFRAQISQIRELLTDNLKELSIDTVERFQGSERDIIILSLALSNQSQLDFIQSLNDEKVDRKLNVAITRAKHQLIVLGTEEILENNKIYSRFIEYVKSIGGYHLDPDKEKDTPNIF